MLNALWDSLPRLYSHRTPLDVEGRPLLVIRILRQQHSQCANSTEAGLPSARLAAGYFLAGAAQHAFCCDGLLAGFLPAAAEASR